MFTQKFYNADPSKATRNRDPARPNSHMADYGYGKHGVRVFQLKKDGALHTALEYKVNLHMRLRTHKEYYEANNSEIVGSDVLETILYIHAQKHGLRTPEEFALSLTQYYMDTYEAAVESNLIIEVMGWDRLGECEKRGYYKDKPHDHAFMQNLNGRRRCEVIRRRGDPQPVLIGGITELRMIKTARAPFVGYAKGELYTEGDNPDRILCVDVNAKWEYKTVEGIDFETHWHCVRDLIIQSFAGHPVDGTAVTSVQYFSYNAGSAILAAMPEICSVSINMKNLPQVPYDFSRFPDFEHKTDVVIVKPVDDPHGVAYIQTDRLEAGQL